MTLIVWKFEFDVMRCDFTKRYPWVSRALRRIRLQTELAYSLPCRFFIGELMGGSKTSFCSLDPLPIPAPPTVAVHPNVA
jgi:hypothetical protein